MATKIKMVFDNQLHGILTGHHGSSQVGPAEGALDPYDMVLGGLGGCLNHTLQSILDKKRIKVQGIHYDIEGEKRTEPPTTLKYVDVRMQVRGADEEAKNDIEKAFELATRYCSVYQTLSKVATMRPKLTFEE